MESPGSMDTGAVDQAWHRIAEGEFDPVQRDQYLLATAAKDALAGTLMEELKGEIATGGPTGAVGICRDLAPMIADDVADVYGVAIGRTSHRLRNALNAPPLWAEGFVEEQIREGVFLEGPEGELGVMLPITVAPPCLACHGPAETMDEGVLAALAESYPNDRATGFAEGDLRGWFWIEVPAEGS